MTCGKCGSLRGIRQCDNCHRERCRALGDRLNPGRAERRSARLYQYGTASRLARELGVCQQAVQQEIDAQKRGKCTSHRIREALLKDRDVSCARRQERHPEPAL